MKFDFGKKKNNLDEFQEQKLVHIERDSFWILYWLILIEMVLEIMIRKDPTAVIGEWICFMIISVIVVVRCLRNGIWDRRVKATRKSNLMISIIAAAVVFILLGAISYSLKGEKIGLKTIVLQAGIAGVCTLVVTFIVASILAFIYRKRLGRLEGGDEE